jgi:oligopeptide/dipeptide ABC transporter ATP-binding protein
VRDIFHSPLHLYTVGLLKSVPRMSLEKRKLYVIPGMVPSIGNLPEGCRFHPRCDRATEACKKVQPQLVEAEPGRKVRCIRYGAVGSDDRLSAPLDLGASR